MLRANWPSRQAQAFYGSMDQDATVEGVEMVLQVSVRPVNAGEEHGLSFLVHDTMGLG